MLREACDLASKNVDEATKLENKGLIAQLVRLPVPLASRREFGRGRERARLGAAHRGGMGTHPAGAHPVGCVCIQDAHPMGCVLPRVHTPSASPGSTLQAAPASWCSPARVVLVSGADQLGAPRLWLKVKGCSRRAIYFN